MATIQIPRQLRPYTNNDQEIIVPGNFLLDVIINLIQQYPLIKPYLLDEKGDICKFVSIYLNGKDVRLLEGSKTPIGANDILTIIPAIAGG